MELLSDGDGSAVLTRRFVAERAIFAIRTSAELAPIIEQLFADLDNPGNADTPAGFAYFEIVLRDHQNGYASLHVPQTRDLISQPVDSILAAAVTAVSRLALDTNPRQLHLHCAALALEGAGVIISAPSGTGKTTLAASLARRGWSYTSDEAVTLSADSAIVAGFSKPMVIKSEGRELIPELAAARVAADPGNIHWWLIPASRIPTATTSRVEPSVIIILHRTHDGRLDLPSTPTRLHPCDAVVALMSQTMDPERFGSKTLDVLAKLASGCACVSLPVGPLDSMTTAIEELVETESKASSAMPVTLLSSPDGDNDQWRIAPAARSALIGDRVVVHAPDTGAIAGLDEAGSAVWLTLAGQPPSWFETETLTLPATLSFMRQLESHGLVLAASSQETP